MNQSRVTGPILSVLTAVTLLGAPAAAQDTIKIGVLAPLSGGGAYIGEGTLAGVDVAVKELNEAGGVMGRTLEVLSRDTQLKPDVASAVAKELITKEGVGFFVGPISSGTFGAVSELAKQEKVIVTAPVATSEAITSTNLHPYVFQYPSTTDVAGERFAEVLKNIGAAKVCFVGYDYSYTHDITKSIRENIGEIEVTGEFLLPVNATDYSTMVTQLLANECDTIWGGMFGGGFIAFVKQAQPFGILDNKKLVWGSFLGDPATASAMKGDFPENLWSSSLDLWYYDGGDAHSAYQAAMTEHRGGKEDTSVFSLPAYTLTKMIAAGIEKAQSTDPTEVAKALEGLTLDTPVGPITIDAETHRMNAPEFFGKIVTVDGLEAKRMTEITLFK